MALIDQLDPATASAEDLQGWCEIAGEVDQELRPGEAARPLASHLARVRGVEHAWVEQRWVARAVGGDVIGCCTATWPDTPQNRDAVFVEIEVPAAHRRKRVGTDLMLTAAAHARSNSRSMVTIEAKSGSAGTAFLAALGADQRTVSRRSLLEVSSVDMVALREWGRPAASADGRYALVQWRNSTPEHLLDEHADLRTAMNDAPRERLELEDEIYTPARIRAYEDTLGDRGDELWVTCVRDEASGQLVALTDLNGPGGWPEWAYQEDTVVLAEHRGHGLGRWIKAANLAYLLADRPSTAWVQTFNAEVNRHMLDINEAMGFRPADEWAEWQVRIDAVETALRA